jgi:hypothetical protein
MIKKSIVKIDNGIKVSFSGKVEKQQIVKIVENCSAGKCECMSSETKSKIKGMEVSGNDGEVELTLNGEISEKEIEKALKKSKIINSSDKL